MSSKKSPKVEVSDNPVKNIARSLSSRDIASMMRVDREKVLSASLADAAAREEKCIAAQHSTFESLQKSCQAYGECRAKEFVPHFGTQKTSEDVRVTIYEGSEKLNVRFFLRGENEMRLDWNEETQFSKVGGEIATLFAALKSAREATIVASKEVSDLRKQIADLGSYEKQMLAEITRSVLGGTNEGQGILKALKQASTLVVSPAPQLAQTND